MLITKEHNSNSKKVLDRFDLIDHEHRLNTQLLELDKIQVGVENMSYAFDYVVTTIENKQPIIKDLVNYNIRNSLNLLGLNEYDVLDGTESFSHILSKIGDFIKYIFEAIITIIKKVIEFISDIIKSIIEFIKSLFTNKNNSGSGGNKSSRDKANDQIRKAEDTISDYRNHPEKLSKKKIASMVEDIDSIDEQIMDTLKKLPIYLLQLDEKNKNVELKTLIEHGNTIKDSLKFMITQSGRSELIQSFSNLHKYGGNENEDIGTLLGSQLKNIVLNFSNKENEKDYQTSLNNMFNSYGETFMKVVDNLEKSYRRKEYRFEFKKYKGLYKNLNEVIDINNDVDDKKERSIVSITTNRYTYIEYIKDTTDIDNEVDEAIEVLWKSYHDANLPKLEEKDLYSGNMVPRDGVDIKQDFDEIHLDHSNNGTDMDVLFILKKYLFLIKKIYESGTLKINDAIVEEDVYKDILDKIKIVSTKKETDVNKLSAEIKIFFVLVDEINGVIEKSVKETEKLFDGFIKRLDKTVSDLEASNKMVKKALPDITNTHMNNEAIKLISLVKDFSSFYGQVSKDTTSETKNLVEVIKRQYMSDGSNHTFAAIERLEDLLFRRSIRTMLIKMKV